MPHSRQQSDPTHKTTGNEDVHHAELSDQVGGVDMTESPGITISPNAELKKQDRHYLTPTVLASAGTVDKYLGHASLSPHPAYRILRSRGIDQRAVAAAVGYSQPYVSYMLTAAKPATELFRTRLAAFLEIPARDLFASDEDVWAWKLSTLLDQAPPSARAQAMRVRLALEPGRDPANVP